MTPGPSRRSDVVTLRLAARVGQAVRETLVLTGQAAWRGVIGIYQSDDLTYAASVAYYALLSLFPFFLIALAVLGAVTKDEADRLAVINFLLRYFPRRLGFITHQLDAMRQTPLRIGIGGMIGLTWAALGVFSAISSAVNHAWRVEQQRSYLKHKLFSFVMLVAAGALLLAALLLVSAIQVAEASWFASPLTRLPGLALLTGVAMPWTTTLMLIVVVGLIFYFVPNAPVRFRDVWAGAVVTGLLWRGALVGFSYYVRDMSRYTEVHGSIGAVVVFLIWVYISAVILLYGVEMTAAYARLRSRRSEETTAAPSPRR